MTDTSNPNAPEVITRPVADIPESFFAPTRAASEAAVLHKLGSPPPENGWQPQKAMYWYDSIIDWMFANPGGALKECAAALGRNPVTIGLIVRSDLFKARYAQRRARFSADLDHRLVGKLARVAEISLDSMVDALEKKRDTVPLPVLHEIAKGAMDRLGYGPSRSETAAASVIINNNPSASVGVVLPASVSPDALAKARGYMAALQGTPPLLEQGNPPESLVPSEGED